MAESNLKEMMIDDINEDADEENQIIDSQPKLKWYLIDTERTFCKVWNFVITMLTIYTLFVSPYILTFKHVYITCFGCGDGGEDEYNQTLVEIELAIDIIYFIEICLNFVKRTRAHKELSTIGYNYLTGFFIFDVVSTLPELFMGEIFDYYYLKIFRIIHFTKLTLPLNLLLTCVLQKYSKKRQNDLTSFAGLILYVIYLSHIMACIWLMIGVINDCGDPAGADVEENCT
jgi:hypothetical protein